MQEQIPWVIVSTSEEDWYLAVAIHEGLATEPKQVYADRLKKLVGEDLPVFVSFNRVTFKTLNS